MMCFARIRFRHCQIPLPLFERGWQSLKQALRHYSLPKVQFAAKTLPKDFSVSFGKRQAVFACKIGSCSHLSMAMRQGYVAIHTRSQFHASLQSCLLGPIHTSMTLEARSYYIAGACLQGSRKAAISIFPRH